jgi:hypothetical protein
MLHAARQLPSWLTYNVRQKLFAPASRLVFTISLAMKTSYLLSAVLCVSSSLVAHSLDAADGALAPFSSTLAVPPSTPQTKEALTAQRFSRPEIARYWSARPSAVRLQIQNATTFPTHGVPDPKIQQPNKALEPTTPSGTPRAPELPAESPRRNDGRITARVAPAVVVAHL